MSRGWARAGGVGGLLFFGSLLVLISVGPLTNPTPEPAFDAPSSAFLTFARSARGDLYPLALAGSVGMFGFLLFAAALIARLRSADGVTSAPVILVALAAAVFTVLWFAELGIGLAEELRHANLDAAGASVFYGLANGIFVVSWAAIGGFLAATALAALRSRTMPRWLTWSALVIGVALFLAVAVPLSVVWYLPYFLFYFWILAVSVVLLRS